MKHKRGVLFLGLHWWSFSKGSSHELTMVKVSIDPSTYGSTWYVKTYWNFSIIHKRLPFVDWTQAYLSLSFSTSITNLLTGCSRYWRAISVVPNVPSIGQYLPLCNFSFLHLLQNFSSFEKYSLRWFYYKWLCHLD